MPAAVHQHHVNAADVVRKQVANVPVKRNDRCNVGDDIRIFSVTQITKDWGERRGVRMLKVGTVFPYVGLRFNKLGMELIVIFIRDARVGKPRNIVYIGVRSCCGGENVQELDTYV